MSIQTWTYIIVGITFSIYIGIAIWSRVQSTKEFYVAGGGVGAWANGMATAADWMSAASFISMANCIPEPKKAPYHIDFLLLNPAHLYEELKRSEAYSPPKKCAALSTLRA